MLTDNKILDATLRREGWPKYTNRKADLGGPTKGGITLPVLSEHRGVPCTITDLKLMDRAECEAIYLKRYFAPYGWIGPPHERLRVLLIDYAITSWHDDAIGDLQHALGVTADGKVGPQTKAALTAATDPATLYQRVYRMRQNKFIRTAFDSEVAEFLRTHPRTQMHNLAGWLNRLSEFV